MAGDLSAAVEQHQLRGAQQHPDPVADQPGRDRVVALADRDPGIAVDPRRQRQPGLEHLGRQRPQQVGLEGEVLTDADGAVADPAVVIGQVVADQQFVELGHRRDYRDRDQVVAAEPAALALHPALLMGALDTGVAVERVEPVDGTGTRPSGPTRCGCGRTAPARPRT